MSKKYLVINCITFDEEVITVHATDNERWFWDLEEGESGIDAMTRIWVTIKSSGEEVIDYYPSFDYYSNDFSKKHQSTLLRVARVIKNDFARGVLCKTIQKKFFGLKIK